MKREIDVGDDPVYCLKSCVFLTIARARGGAFKCFCTCDSEPLETDANGSYKTDRCKCEGKITEGIPATLVAGFDGNDIPVCTLKTTT